MLLTERGGSLNDTKTPIGEAMLRRRIMMLAPSVAGGLSLSLLAH
jgi:hypothetical protein